MSRKWTTCTRCNRVLWAEDGPTCPECLEAIACEEAEATEKAKHAPAEDKAKRPAADK